MATGDIPPPPAGFQLDSGMGGPAPSAPTPPQYDSHITPQAYFGVVKSLYPNAVFNGGGRDPAQNAAVGGAVNSMHLTNQAMDFTVPGVPSSQVFARLRTAGLPITEALNENYTGLHSTGPHLHVGWRPVTQDAAPAATGGGSAGIPPPPPGFSLQGTPQAPQQPPSAIPPPPAGFQLQGQPTAAPAPAPKPNWLEQTTMDLANNPIIKGMHGSYMEGVTNGLFIQPTRMLMEMAGVGMDKLKAAYPGQSDEWYSSHLHQMYTNAIDLSRQGAQQETQQAAIKPDQYSGTSALITGPDQRSLPNAAARLAQQTLNFGASMAGTPEYLAMGGSGKGATVVGRIVNAGLKNAGVAAAANAAAQGMDLITGQKKSFDIQQNLEQAATGAVIGGSMHGVVEAAPVVSDFVKGLFGRRGVDTLPAADPRGSPITPMSGDHVQLNATDATTYKQLLQTGSVDDIKNFFKGRNGPQPSYQDVNTWVQHRDNVVPGVQPNPGVQPDFDYETAYNQQAEQQYAEQNRQAVEDHIVQQTASWKNAPQFEVVHGPEDIADPAIRAQALKQDPDQTGLGFHGPDGIVRMFSGRIDSPDLANAVMFHEGLGHYGLEQQFGDKLDAVLTTLLDRNVGKLGRDTDAWQAKNPGAYGGNRVRAAEEVLANASQAGPLKKSWQDAVTSSIRQFGRKMGLNLAYSDGEVRHILSMAHDAVINGKGRSAAANNFRSPNPDTPNKFMFTGPKSESGVNPWSSNAVRGSDNILRDEISDRHSRFTPSPHYPGEDTSAHVSTSLGNMLDHPDLYAQYPQLKDMPVHSYDMGKGYGGAYDDVSKSIHLNNTRPIAEQHTTILHEAQHAIQDIEQYPGFVAASKVGGTEHMSSSDYAKDINENEARATEARQYLNSQERAAQKVMFMRKSDIASDPTYKSDDLERIYHSLSENYEPNKTTIPWAETRRSALDLGVKPSQIKDLSEKTPGDLATRVYRMGVATNMLDMRIQEIEGRLGTKDQTAMDQINYIQALVDHNYLMARLKGETSEAGRALNVAKAFGSYTNSTMFQVAELLREQGSGLASLADDPETFLDFARKVQAMRDGGANPKGAIAMLQAVSKPYLEQYLTSLHLNMMLSALSTHVKAPIDMGTGISRDVIEKALAIPVGKLRQMLGTFTGKGMEPGIHPTELLGNLYGSMKAVTEAEVYRRMAHAAKTGEGSYVDANGEAIPTNFNNQFGAVSNPNLGPVLSLPTHLISAQDTFFRSWAMMKHLYGLGNREAYKQLGPKASWDDINTLGSSLARTPSDAMLNEAKELSNRELLLNNNPLNKALDKVRGYHPGMSGWARVGAFITGNLAPFIRVESNSLLNRVIQRSPLGMFDPYTLSQLKAGGPKADLAFTRMAYGTVLAGMSWVAADKAKNYLMGNGPDSVDKYKQAIAQGFSPRSVHENGRYNESNSVAMSVNPFDEHNATATMIAGMRQAFDKGANQGQIGTGVKLALGSIFHNLASMTWVSDLAPAIDAATNSDLTAPQKFNQFVGNEAKSWVPNGLNQAARLIDPNRHDVIDPDSISGTVSNEVQSAIPGASKGLPIKYSVYGDPLQNGQSVTGVHTWIPGQPGNGTNEITDPAELEMKRLDDQMSTSLITPVQKIVKLDDGTTKKLTTSEFENYQHIVGINIVAQVKQAMSDPSWQQMDDNDKAYTVRDIETQVKADAREQLFGQ